MTAQESEQEKGAPSTASPVLSMRELLASCAAADAVSRPPSASSAAPGTGDAGAPETSDDQRRGRDAA